MMTVLLLCMVEIRGLCWMVSLGSRTGGFRPIHLWYSVFDDWIWVLNLVETVTSTSL